MKEQQRARRKEIAELRPLTEAREKIVARPRENPEDIKKNALEKRASGLKKNDIVERMDANGEPEYWRVLEANENVVTLSFGDRRAVMSRQEVALEERAVQHGPQIAKHWEKILSITDLIADEEKRTAAVERLNDHKASIIEMAAFAAAENDPADLEIALQNATGTIINERKVQHADSKELQNKARQVLLKRATQMNDGLLQLRTETIWGALEDTAVANGNADAYDDEDTDLTQVSKKSGPATPQENTGKIDVKFSKAPSGETPATLPFLKSEAAHLAIDLPRIALAPARGEVTPYAALEVMLAFDPQQMDKADIDAHVARLQTLREQIDLNAHEEDPARYFAILDIQNRQQALLAERATMSAENPGAATRMVTEIRAVKAVDRKRGRPVNVDALVKRLQEANVVLDELEQGTAEWSLKSQENWDLEKRILVAKGLTEALKPENFSQLYSFYKEAVKGGQMSKEDALVALMDLGRESQTLSGKDVEGLQTLYEEFSSVTNVEVEDDVDQVGSSLNDDFAVIEHEPEVVVGPYDAAKDLRKGPKIVEINTSRVSKNATKHRPIPLNTLRGTINKQYGQRPEPKMDLRREPAIGSERTPLTDLKPEPKVFATAESRDNEKMLRPGLTPDFLRRDISEDDWMAEGDSGEVAFSPSAEQPTQGASFDNLYANENIETPRIENTPYLNVTGKFGGPREFPRLYKELQQENLAPFDLDALYNTESMSRTEQQRMINQVSDAVRTLQERRGEVFQTKETVKTPFAQVAEEFGGEEQFRETYQQLQDQGLAPFKMENLEGVEKLKRSTPQELVKAMNDAIKVMEAREGRFIREATPYEHIAEELGGVDALREMYASLTEADGKPPYTLEQLQTMKKPTLFQRFMPGVKNPVNNAIAQVRKFMANAEKRGRKTDTFSGRRGGRGQI